MSYNLIVVNRRTTADSISNIKFKKKVHAQPLISSIIIVYALSIRAGIVQESDKQKIFSEALTFPL